MANATNNRISTHDKAVLNRIFNPSLPYGDTAEEVPQAESETAVESESDEVKQAKQLELEAVKEAEAGHIDRSLELLNRAISIAPEYASSYNNRAQALRLQGDIHGALQDLNKAIELSRGRGKVACQAYTQRGLIKRLEDGKKLDYPNWKAAADNMEISLSLQDLDKAIELSRGRGKVACQAYTQRGLIKRLEEDENGAKEDLRNAANLGGQFAKQLLVTLNPYAALCNQMLSDVMNRLRSGQSVNDAEDENGAKEDLRNAANLGGQFAKQLLVTLNPYAALCNQMLSDVMNRLRSGQSVNDAD